jgi:hypothetical protein
VTVPAEVVVVVTCSSAAAATVQAKVTAAKADMILGTGLVFIYIKTSKGR